MFKSEKRIRFDVNDGELFSFPLQHHGQHRVRLHTTAWNPINTIQYEDWALLTVFTEREAAS